MSAFVFGLFGFRIYSVAHELDNPLLDRFVTKFREARGQIILPKKGIAPDVALVLENNGVIGLLGDRECRRHLSRHRWAVSASGRAARHGSALRHDPDMPLAWLAVRRDQRPASSQRHRAAAGA